MEPVERNISEGHETNVLRNEDFEHPVSEVERSGTVIKEEGTDSEQEENNRDCSPEQQAQTQKHDPLSPRGPVPEVLCKGTLLHAFRELGIKDPDTFYEKCCDDAKKLRISGALDRYVLTYEEAVTVCTAFRLMKRGFCFDKVFEGEKLSYFRMAVLVSIRKLPVYESKLLYCHKLEARIRRGKRDIITWPFCFASKNMTIAEEFLCSNNITGRFVEVLSIEEGWGYDVSDFVLTDDDETEGKQGKFVSVLVFVVHFNQSI